MDQDLHLRLLYELKTLEDLRDRYASRLSLLDEYREQRLKRHQPKEGRSYYCIKRKGSPKYKYAGKESNLRIQRIKEASHLEKALSIFSNNIVLIESILDGYAEYDYASIDNDLPVSYRSEMSYPHDHYREIGKKWKEEKLAQQAGFPENYPENKTERTSDGTMVKTLSEMLLYERFLSAGLVFVYELPLPSIDYGPNLYPDFTILSPLDLKTEILVEYVGRLDMPNYREDFAKRIYRLMKNGYIPGVNLLLVFGDLNGHVDSLQVSKVIADICGLR